MPTMEAIKAIANMPMRAIGAIGAKVERASRTTRHRLAREIVRRRWSWAFLLASTWMLWASTAFLVWIALTNENPNVRPWLNKARLWVVVFLPAMGLLYETAAAKRRWELLLHRQRYRKARKAS